MKVGILTFHDADNYGAVLQCYALQETIKAMGHDVSVINYKQSHIVELYSSRTIFNVRDLITLSPSKLKQEAKKLLNLQFNRVRHNSFNEFRSKYLNLTDPVDWTHIPHDFDAYIVGSDQIWSYSCCGGIDPVYWGQFQRDECSKLIGYAISGNGDFVGKLPAANLKRYIDSFERISFREQKLADFVAKEVGGTFPVVLDPTLLSNEKIWQPLINNKWSKRNGYVVVYQARTYKSKPSMILNRAKEYASLHHLDVINLLTGDYGVSDFISAIKYADVVFTSSFHATVFSIIFATPFFSFRLNDGKDDRYVNLLNKLQMNHHLVEPMKTIKDKIVPDANVIKNNLQTLRNSSFDYLHDCLNNKSL